MSLRVRLVASLAADARGRPRHRRLPPGRPHAAGARGARGPRAARRSPTPRTGSSGSRSSRATARPAVASRSCASTGRAAVTRSFPSGFASDPDPLPVLPVYPDGIPGEAYGVIEDRPRSTARSQYRVLTGTGPAQRDRRRSPRRCPASRRRPGRSSGTLVARRRRRDPRADGRSRTSSSGAGSCRSSASRTPRRRSPRATCRTGPGIPHDDTEVGRLGAAFDSMLDQIEGSFAEQQAALEAKARSEDRLRRFVADASHELRTPLTAVRGYADLYRAGGPRRPGRARDGDGPDRDREPAHGPASSTTCCSSPAWTRAARSAVTSVDLSRIAADAVADARAVEPGRPIVDAIDDGIVGPGRRGPPAPGHRQPAGQRPGAHAARRRPSRSCSGGDGTGRRAADRRPRAGHRPRARRPRLRPLLPRRSRPLAAIAAAPGWASRSSRPSSPRSDGIDPP